MKKLTKIITTSLFAAAVLSPLAHAGETTLFEKLGGDTGVTAIVHGTLEHTLADDRIAHTFEESNVQRVEDMIVLQICSLTGGGCDYTGMDMATAHRGLELTSMHFHALVENMQKAMDDEDVPFTVQNQLLALLAPMHGDVVHPEKHFKKAEK